MMERGPPRLFRFVPDKQHPVPRSHGGLGDRRKFPVRARNLAITNAVWPVPGTQSNYEDLIRWNVV